MYTLGYLEDLVLKHQDKPVLLQYQSAVRNSHIKLSIYQSVNFPYHDRDEPNIIFQFKKKFVQTYTLNTRNNLNFRFIIHRFDADAPLNQELFPMTLSLNLPDIIINPRHPTIDECHWFTFADWMKTQKDQLEGKLLLLQLRVEQR